MYQQFGAFAAINVPVCCVICSGWFMNNYAYFMVTMRKNDQRFHDEMDFEIGNGCTANGKDMMF